MNKRTLFTLITILVLAGIAACVIFIYYIPYQKEYALYKDTFMPKQKMQDDFDYVWDFVENGYPFKNVCIRAGTDLKIIKEEYTNRLHEPKNEFEYYLFYLGLFNKITKEKQVGHLNIYDMSSVHPVTKNVQNTRLYDNDAEVRQFYEKAFMCLNDVSGIHINKLEALLKKYNVNLPIEDSDREKNDESMLISKIIKEKKIAYIGIKSFSPYNKAEYINRLCNMLKSFEGYEHLIIDVCENIGGDKYIWSKYLVSPIIKESGELYTKIAYDSENEYFKKYESNFLQRKMGQSGNLESFQFAGQNKEDKDLFDSIINYGFGIHPGDNDTNFTINFTGRIWLLINGKTQSAADRFAYFAKGKKGNAEPFATLVGENTGGIGLNLLSSRLYLKLPESNMLIQSNMTYGLNPDGSCHDEFGTAPDIYNLPGKDALETCLEEIRKLGERTNF